MSHMVIFRGADGKAGYHQAEGLEDAARFVERVRNEEGVEQARIFRMEEVPFEFRTYFRVEVRPPGAAVGPPADGAVAGPADEPPAGPADEPPAGPDGAEDPVPVEVDEHGANGRRGLFSR